MNDAPTSSARPGSLEHWAEATPDARALCEGTRELTWTQWNDRANRVAELLAKRANVGPGDRVAVCAQNRLEWFVSQAAIAKLGAELVPVSYRLTPAEIHYIVADCGARAFIFDAEDAGTMARVWTNQPPTERPSQVAVAISILRSDRQDVLSFEAVSTQGPIVARFAKSAPRSIVYTSGTTGRPRGVVNAQKVPSDAAPKAERVPGPSTAAERGIGRNLLGAPLNHAAGQASARATLVGGGTVFIMPRFDPEETLRIIEREKITISFLVPTMLNRIVNLPKAVLDRHDVSSIRVITTGASPCPQSVKEKVIAYFGDHCLFESYGSTEVGIIARMLPQDHIRKPGSCGRLIDGVEVRIVDDQGNDLPRNEIGEIKVKTRTMIERYLNQGAPSELVDGFFATGDVGRFDEDGFLYILDRKKDMIIGGGVNIYPAEIENALREHPSVLDAAVFGIPHPELGEQVKAVVECNSGCSVDEADLLAFVADRLAAYKRPRSIDFVAEIPRNPAGKVLKAQLRAPFWAGAGRAI
jgi:long-chain acyl-CoA synthetase